MTSPRLPFSRECVGESGRLANPPRFAVHVPFISLNAD
jgi:hypothetical protein